MHRTVWAGVAVCAVASLALALSARAQDGQHDFDFELGHWHIHLKQRLHPLTGSNTWVEFDGTSTTRPIWNGQGEIEEFETKSPSGHIEGLTLRTYNSQTRQWRLYWANSKNGILLVPQIGEFKDGVGEFYAQDSLNGGKTWEVNWISSVDVASRQ